MTPTVSQPARARKSPPAQLAAAALPPPGPLARELGIVTLLFLATVAAFSLIFPPVELWPLGFICLVPWATAVCRAGRAWVVHWLAVAAGWLFFLINVYWLMPVTGLGYAALALYLALYWPLAAWAIRTGRRHGISPIWTLPVTWVACEYLRGWVMSGFPWFFLGHAFYRQLPLIQISDLTGVYGVSFAAAMVNGLIAELALQRWPGAGRGAGRRQVLIGGCVTVALLAGQSAYGLMQLRNGHSEPGPKIAVIQEDFPLSSTPPYGDPTEVVFARYLALAGQAAAHKPDLLAFPETAWNSTQNIGFVEQKNQVAETVSAGAWSFGKLCHEATAALARGDYDAVNQRITYLERIIRAAAQRNPDSTRARELPRLPNEGGHPTTLLVGAVSVEVFPEATYPKSKRYNSALVYDRDGTQRRERFDKVHLVPFGEIVPFRYGRLHRLYIFLNSLSPFSHNGSYEYSLTPGERFTVFTLEADGRTWRFGTPICYEDVMPYVVRQYVWGGGQRRVDFLVNISNDGWFLHSAELPQHLAICVFRAVENRVGIARAVNTGISGFVAPDGRLYSLVEKDGRTWGAGIVGFRVDRVQIDRRDSFYGKTGDWFAGLCLLLTALLWLNAIGARWIAATWRHVFTRRKMENVPQ